MTHGPGCKYTHSIAGGPDTDWCTCGPIPTRHPGGDEAKGIRVWNQKKEGNHEKTIDYLKSIIGIYQTDADAIRVSRDEGRLIIVALKNEIETFKVAQRCNMRERHETAENILVLECEVHNLELRVLDLTSELEELQQELDITGSTNDPRSNNGARADGECTQRSDSDPEPNLQAGGGDPSNMRSSKYCEW